MTEVLGRELSPNPSLGQPDSQAPLAETAAALRWLRAGLSEETMRLELAARHSFVDLSDHHRPTLGRAALWHGVRQHRRKLGRSQRCRLSRYRAVPYGLAHVPSACGSHGATSMTGRFPVIDGVVHWHRRRRLAGGFDNPFIYCLSGRGCCSRVRVGLCSAVP